MIGTLFYAQESAVIQILLEFCISKELLNEDKGKKKYTPHVPPSPHIVVLD